MDQGKPNMVAIDFLVGGIPTPLKNMSSSVGMIIPNTWRNKSHVPNHQPVLGFFRFNQPIWDPGSLRYSYDSTN
jgi:hypothetical protein